MHLNNVIEVFATIKPYYDLDARPNRITGQTHSLLLDPPETPMDREDVTKMIRLGCVQPENHSIASNAEYDPTDYWLIYI